MKRDLQLDSLRGFFLVIMALDHMTVLIFRNYIYQTVVFFTAADGFIFLSGFIYGLVYFRFRDESVFLKKKSWKRAFTIYKYHLALCLVFIIESILMKTLYGYSSIDSVSPIINHPFNYGIKFLLLIYAPGWFAILPLYVVFLLLGPFFIQQINKNGGRLLLVFSIILYIIAQIPFFKNGLANFEGFADIQLPAFNIFEWQLLFILGVYFGTQKNKKGIELNSSWKGVIAALSIIIAGIYLRQYYEPAAKISSILFDIQNLSIFRVINFLSALYIVAYIRKYIVLKKRGYFSFLGQYSLEVYAFHLIVIVHFNNLFGKVEGIILAEYILPVLVVFSLLIPAYLAERYKHFKSLNTGKSIFSAIIQTAFFTRKRVYDKQ